MTSNIHSNLEKKSTIKIISIKHVNSSNKTCTSLINDIKLKKTLLAITVNH